MIEPTFNASIGQSIIIVSQNNSHYCENKSQSKRPTIHNRESQLPSNKMQYSIDNKNEHTTKPHDNQRVDVHLFIGGTCESYDP